MNKSLFKMFSAFTMFALMMMALPMQNVGAAATELFFSEYTEGTSFNKAVEIYNGTGAAVGLATYTVELYSNGAASPSQSVALSGTLADGDVFVIAHGSADGAILTVADMTNNTVINFNGDDAVVLRNNGTVVDVIGQVGFDPGSQWGTDPVSTADNTIRRKANVCSGDTTETDVFDPSVEWDGFAINTFDGFGSHTANCQDGDLAPTVASTTPSDGATDVAVTANIDVTFSEAVNATAASFGISCGTSGAHTAAVTGGPTTFTLNPDADFANSETCTVTVVAAQVTDQDTDDPPDNMGTDYTFSFTTFTPLPPSAVIINELDSDTPGTDAAEFVELYDGGAGNTDLTGLAVVFYNGSNDLSYAAFDLDGFSTNAGGYFLLGNSSVTPTPNLTFAGNLLQNGADAVALYQGDAASFPNNTPVTTANLVDAVVYDTADPDDAGLLVLLNAGQPQVDESSGGDPATQSIQRCPNGSGGARNTTSYAQFVPSAGAANACATDDAPTVTSTSPTSGAANVLVNSNIDITFSEAVSASNSSFTISCTTSGTHTTVVSGGPTTYTLNPDTDFVTAETCTVTVLAAQVSDQDTIDPPDNMAADYSFGFSTEGPVCEQIFTPIYDIQGSGTSAAITGNVTTQGVVVGDFEGPTSQGIQGFYLQDATGDGNAATSDGIFVFTGDNDNSLSAGQVVRVTGFARERFNQTALNGSNSNTSPVTTIVNCGTTGTVTPTDVMMPFDSSTYLERFEGMLVRFPQSLVIAEYFNYDRFGEMVLALPLEGESRPFTGTAIDEPGAPANARTLANSLRRITLDDRLGIQNPEFLRHPNGNAFALDNRFRGGDTVQDAVGVLGFDFSLYRIQPTAPATYTSVNPRPAAPEAVGGNVQVAAMNTLNFFLTLDAIDDDPPATDNPADNVCGGNANLECRGADGSQPNEFTRQRDKLLAALAGLDADIIGLNELENTPNVDPLGDPTNGIVPGLNNLVGAGTYSYLDTGVIGTDAIRVGLIYKPGVVTPVGAFQTIDESDDSRFNTGRNRPSLAQTFEVNATGARFTVVVNHLKSKGSGCGAGDDDTTNGQGNCNGTRTLAAQALVDWLATDPTGSGDPDFLIMGDLNSYAMEDPIDAIKAGSDDNAGTGDDFTNLIFDYQGPYAYSYTFDGQAGYLDHALANTTLAAQVTGAADWHINSDEPDVVDYDTSFKGPTQEGFYEPNPYRSSDHDPVIVGLNLLDTTPPTVTIDQATGQSDPTGLSPINFTAVFSEPVSGFDGSDVALSGTAGATTAVVTEVAPNDGTTYNVAVSGMTANGTVIASIPAGAATDAGGNSSAASTSTDNTVTYNNTAPTIAVAAGGMCASSGGTMNLTVTDAEGDVLTLSGISSNTSAVPNTNIVFGGSGSNRTVTITAVPAATVRTAVITITVSDGISTSSTTITVVVGTTGNNAALNGTSGADLILALSGNDILNGLAGNDLLCAGAGNDVVSGGDNDDTLDGSTGNDVLSGGNGNDSLSGGDNNDVLNGENGDDSLSGGNGNDALNGGANNDSLSGGSGNDALTGGTGADFFSGGPGSDANADFNAGQGDTSDGT